MKQTYILHSLYTQTVGGKANAIVCVCAYTVSDRKHGDLKEKSFMMNSLVGGLQLFNLRLLSDTVGHNIPAPNIVLNIRATWEW